MTQPPPPDATSQPGVDFTRLSQADAVELLHYKTQLEAVERISQALFQSIDLDELVETTLHIALEEVGAEAGSILFSRPGERRAHLSIFNRRQAGSSRYGHCLGQRHFRRRLPIRGGPDYEPGQPGCQPIFAPSIRRRASSPTT